MKDYLFTAAGKEYLAREYVARERSTYEIAQERRTYPNLVRRALLHHNIPLRDHARAQKLALRRGRHAHPTLGKTHSRRTRQRIGEGVALSWPKERARRVDAARRQWAAMTAGQKGELRQLAFEALRKSAREGSHMEHFLAGGLCEAGYRVETVSQGKDIILPLEKVVILVDGPAHFLPVWGEKKLAQVMEEDRKLMDETLASGVSVVRVRNVAKSVSETRLHRLLTDVLSLLDSMRETQEAALAELEVS